MATVWHTEIFCFIFVAKYYNDWRFVHFLQVILPVWITGTAMPIPAKVNPAMSLR